MSLAGSGDGDALGLRVAPLVVFPGGGADACGGGAGLAAVYNVPLGGALFTAEIMMGTITLPVGPACPGLLGTATATAWLYLPRQATYLGVPSYRFTVPLLVWALLAGPLIGLVASGYIRLIGWVTHHAAAGRAAVFAPVAAFGILELRCVSGTLSEIATVWRRAGPCRPDLPLGLPLQLEAATHQLARTVDDLAWAGAGYRPDLACPVTEQMSALERDLAAAKAMTCGAGIPPVGDTGLWERLDTAMHRARARVPAATSRTPAAPNRRENPARGGDLGPVTPGMALHPAGVETGS